MRFGKVIGLMAGIIVFFMAGEVRAYIVINDPTNGETVHGTVTVKAQIYSAWWSKLWVDGKGIDTAGYGNVSFTWNTSGFADGTHTLKVTAYYYGQNVANAAGSIQVVVNNSTSSGSSGHFYTKPKSAPLPGDGTCAAEIPWEQEMVSANYGANHTKPATWQLQTYANNGYAANPWGGSWAFARADGQYTGTTDMIFRWAACKWGIDEDVVRAQATAEHGSWVQMASGGDKRYTKSQCVNGN